MKPLTQWKLSRSSVGLKEFFKFTSFALLSIFLISSIFFAGITRVNALSAEANGDNPLKIVIEPSKDKLDIEEESNEEPISEKISNNIPDLGDDQVFPFAAGLDSY